MKNLTIIIFAAAMIGMVKTPHPQTVSFKLNALCQDHPEKECTEIVEYCRESLESGNECYIITN